jgi:hypothetical protein
MEDSKRRASTVARHDGVTAGSQPGLDGSAVGNTAIMTALRRSVSRLRLGGVRQNSDHHQRR